MRWLRILSLVSCFVLSLAGPVTAGAGEQPEPGPTEISPPEAQAGSDIPPAADDSGDDDTDGEDADYFDETVTAIGMAVDTAHDTVEQNLLDHTVSFDDFFGVAGPNGTRRHTSYELRWRNALRVEEGVEKGWKIRPEMNLRASMVLSKISERLRLTISGENEHDPTTPSLPQDPGNPGFDRTTRTTTRIVNTELRYGLLKTETTDLFLGAGVRVRFPLEAFARGRFSYLHRIDDVTNVRFRETLFVNNSDGFGETTEVALERVLDDRIMFLAAGTATASQETGGIEWGSELALMHELNERAGITFAGGVYGNTDHSALVDTYRILARYRRNYLRSWLFWELEPEVSWPRTGSGRYPATFAVTFRLEILFRGSKGPSAE